MYVYIYIYVYREREREKAIYLCVRFFEEHGVAVLVEALAAGGVDVRLHRVLGEIKLLYNCKHYMALYSCKRYNLCNCPRLRRVLGEVNILLFTLLDLCVSSLRRVSSVKLERYRED